MLPSVQPSCMHSVLVVIKTRGFFDPEAISLSTWAISETGGLMQTSSHLSTWSSRFQRQFSEGEAAAVFLAPYATDKLQGLTLCCSLLIHDFYS